MKWVDSNIFLWARTASLFLAVCASLLLPDVYRKYAIPFRLAKLNQESLPIRPEWESIPNETQRQLIIDILAGPFTYLSKGRQSFAFESCDGQYVLKLFRFGSCAMKTGTVLLSGLKKYARGKVYREINYEETVNSCKLALDLLKEETGIIWAHLNPRAGIWPSFEVRDRLGFRHRIDPGKYRFVLQKRGEKMFYALKKALKKDPAALQRMIGSFCSLLRSLEEKGVATVDLKMPSNFGYFGERAFQLDFASNFKDPSRSHEQIGYFREKLHRWLEKKAPDSVRLLELGLRDC